MKWLAILPAGYKFMLEMHLRQTSLFGIPGFTSSDCGPFTENKKRIQTLKETGDSRYAYQNELYKACLQDDMAWGD